VASPGLTVDAIAAGQPVLRRFLIVCAWMLAGIAFVLIPGMPTVCPLRLVAGIPCPSCGLTRAARDVLHGDFAAATHMHPLWWLVLPFVGTLVALESVAYVRTGRAGEWGQRVSVQRMAVGIMLLLVVVWIARMLGAFGGPVAV
jgi:hypothetical protein